jgi:Cof subfamily protein (haloacid dehalogenase superfamily)
MDGTLLDPSGRISPASVAALHRLSGLGVRIILASGRMSARVLPFIRELGLPLDLIAYNGAEVRECRDGEWPAILARSISDRTRDAVFALCRDHGHFLNVYSGGLLHGYHPAGDFRGGDFYAAQTLAEYAARERRLEALPRQGILKLLVVESPETRDRLYREWEPGLKSHCQVLKSNPEYLEFVDLGTSKGSALAFWLERNGLSPADLLAFGDAENDFEMLRLAGLGIAMANATPGLRAEYSRLSRWTHAEDGVARELASLFPL